MKKFIIAVCTVVLLAFVWNKLYYEYGIYVDLQPNARVRTFMKTEGKSICMERNGAYEPFEIRGVDMGMGIPGKWATDFAIDEETYLRWFADIQEMGANCIRIYTIPNDAFYEAFYQYNNGRKEPLYLLHGVWINDYIANSHRDAYEDLYDSLLHDCRTVVDIIHGRCDISLGYDGVGAGQYRRDISPWVIGYIVGVEWEPSLVTYTNQVHEEDTSFRGEYLYTKKDASPFETMLCKVGDRMLKYESHKYKAQRLLAFSNWPTTDPFSYSAPVIVYRHKVASVDPEHIGCSDKVVSGMFASYHVYSYYPDYLEVMKELEKYTGKEIEERMSIARKHSIDCHMAQRSAPRIEKYLYHADYYDNSGRYNTYLAYLRALNRYHSLPVVISEYGVTTGRGMAQVDKNTNRNQGHMTEEEQGQALVECYKDIMEAGCAGSCVFTWQDEWFKRTWNTMHAIDLNKTPFWSDYQTNEQYFGLLAFDPGEEKTICQVDGDISEWKKRDLVLKQDKMSLFMKYDERYLYLLIRKKDLNPEKDVLYIPFDTTPKSGSTYCENFDIDFERECDFLLVIDGKEDSRLLVQKRYETLYARYGKEYYATNPYVEIPAKRDCEFTNIYLPLILEAVLTDPDSEEPTGEKYETGRLRYGNSNPDSEDFDSLSDFMFDEKDNSVEVRIAWELLNFSNPSEMMIHDDYYEKYGIENLQIDRIWLGLADKKQSGYRIRMSPVLMQGWGEKVKSHERLKRSYYILREYWKPQG
ncbi:MAG: hypothetical protein E7294_01040 [Lachnospiraceae bacterium]|nr:hypothetical protein [Lachnospiraceae bacterium]